jgi:hypothetical protein
MSPKYKNRGLDEAYLKYRAIDNYEKLKPSKTTAFKKLNGIQYMGYKPKVRIDYTKDVRKFSLQALGEGEYFKTFTQSKDRGNKIETEEQSVRHIEWFANNLPSFKKYENDDSCKWMVKDNVLLLAELLEYRNNKIQAVDTFSGDLKAIQRVIKTIIR